ncbi:hypothetical protein IWQ62_002631 [Dispira parvispora]|uniref:Uncharacterized protein n=1 Tax=Dispira parvispora TaxID=1520584 RepID=A0A9W8E3N3_9FUNG|nr:hypothetical protein IWQ62_002631 [Dispira parvispora]
MAVYVTVVLEQLIRLILQELAHSTVKTPKGSDLYDIFNTNDNVCHLFHRMKLKREMERMYRIQPTQRMVHLPGNLFNNGTGRREASPTSTAAHLVNAPIPIASTAPSSTTSIHIHHYPEEVEFVTLSVTSRASHPYSDSDSIRSYSYASLSSTDDHSKAPTLAPQDMLTSTGEASKMSSPVQPNPVASTSTIPRIMDFPLGSSTSLLTHHGPSQRLQTRSRANTLTAFSRAQKKYHLQSSTAPSDTELPGSAQGTSASAGNGKLNLRLSIRAVASSDDVVVRHKVTSSQRKKPPLALPLSGTRHTQQSQSSVNGIPTTYDVKGYSVTPLTVATPTFSKFSRNDLAPTGQGSKSPPQVKESDTNAVKNSAQGISYHLELPEFNALDLETSIP